MRPNTQKIGLESQTRDWNLGAVACSMHNSLYIHTVPRPSDIYIYLLNFCSKNHFIFITKKLVGHVMRHK